MSTYAPSPLPIARPTLFTRAQWHALQALQQQYHQDRDLFTSGELAHLRFLRWLYHSGRLTP